MVRGRGYLKSAGRHRQHGREGDGRHARCWCATSPGGRGVHARGAGRWRAASAIDSVEGTVLLRRGENPKDVLRGLHEAVARINHEMLPPGMRIVPFYDRTRLVDTTLTTVSHNMIEGDRAGEHRGLDVPARDDRLAGGVDRDAAGAADGVRRASTTRACRRTCCRWGRSTSASCWRARSSWSRTPTATWRSRSRRPESVAHVVAESAKEVVRPTLFSMAIIGAAMLPIFTLERVEGRIFRPGRAHLRVRARRARCCSRSRRCRR